MKQWLVPHGSSTPGRRVAGALLSGLVGASVSGLLGALLVRAAGVFRQVVTARGIGLDLQLDAFLLALLVPTLVGGVVGVALNSALVPTLARDPVSRDSGRVLWDAFAAATFIGLAVGLAQLGTAEFLAGLLAGTERSGLSSAVNGSLLWLSFVPMLVIQYEVIASGLIARQRFFAAAALPVFTPASIGVAVALGVRTATGLAIAALIGGAAVVLVGIAFSRRLYGRIEPTIGFAKRTFRSIGREASVLLGAMVIATSTVLVDKLMASGLGTGSISALEYGSRIPEAAMGVTSIAIANAVAQRSGFLAGSGGTDGLRRLLRRTTLWTVVIGTSLGITLIALSPMIVDILYLGGRFTIEDARLVSMVQMAYLAQIPFYLIAILASRVLASMRASRLIALATMTHLVLSVGGNLLLMPLWGVVGIALATSGAYLVTGTGLFVLTRRRLTHRVPAA